MNPRGASVTRMRRETRVWGKKGSQLKKKISSMRRYRAGVQKRIRGMKVVEKREQQQLGREEKKSKVRQVRPCLRGGKPQVKTQLVLGGVCEVQVISKSLLVKIVL